MLTLDRVRGCFALLLTALMLPFFAAHARAQLAVYGTLGVVHVTNPTSTQTLAAGGTNPSYNGTGLQIGAYDTPLRSGPFALGGDVRGSFTTNKTETLLGGARASVAPSRSPFRIYIEALGGLFVRKNVYSNSSAGAAYEILGGVDVTARPHFDFRILEIGAGATSGSDAGAGSSKPSFFTVSTGAVYRF
jgi:hypothetical protein